MKDENFIPIGWYTFLRLLHEVCFGIFRFLSFARRYLKYGPRLVGVGISIGRERFLIDHTILFFKIILQFNLNNLTAVLPKNINVTIQISITYLKNVWNTDLN